MMAMKHPILKTLFFLIFGLGLAIGISMGNRYIAITCAIFLLLPLLPRKWFY